MHGEANTAWSKCFKSFWGEIFQLRFQGGRVLYDQTTRCQIMETLQFEKDSGTRINSELCSSKLVNLSSLSVCSVITGLHFVTVWITMYSLSWRLGNVFLCLSRLLFFGLEIHIQYAIGVRGFIMIALMISFLMIDSLMAVKCDKRVCHS